MEESNGNGVTGDKKRVRVDSDGNDSDLCESKRVKHNTDSDKLPVDLVVSGIDSLEASLIQNDILEILDEQDAITDRDADIRDLDSVIRSFEEEILVPVPAPEDQYGEYQPDLGYLLGASDDELGLPPAVSPPVDDEVKRDAPFCDPFGFENELPSYEPLGFEFGVESDGGYEFVNVGGLFEYAEESSEFLWRPETETLPAV